MEGASSYHQQQHHPISPPMHPGHLPPPLGSSLPPARRWPPPPPKKKIRIEWIRNDAHRRSTFNKRKGGVMKKARELHVLCGVETCVVVYGAGEARPEVWPSWEKAAEMCRRFESSPGQEVSHRTMNHVSFTQDRIMKLRKQIARLQGDIRDLCTRGLLYDALSGRAHLLLRPADPLKLALVKLIMELSTEIHLVLLARRQREGAPTPHAGPATPPPIGLEAAQLAQPPPPPVPPPQVEILQATAPPPISPAVEAPPPNAYSPQQCHHGEDGYGHWGEHGFYPLFNH